MEAIGSSMAQISKSRCKSPQQSELTSEQSGQGLRLGSVLMGGDVSEPVSSYNVAVSIILTDLNEYCT